MTDSEGKSPIIVPLSKKDGTRATTPITGSWRSVQVYTMEADPLHASDRHEPVIGVVAFVPTFLDSGTIIGALPSESVTTPGHVPF